MVITTMLLCSASYLIGSIPTGLVLGKVCARTDIRRAGSGNIGATNAARVLGKKLGALTFAGDMLKGFAPPLAGALLAQSAWAACLCGLAAFLGHLFPVYLRFRGGKGVATAFGVFLYLEPLAVPALLVLFVLVAALLRYVSLASLAAAAALPFVLAAIALLRPVHPAVILTGTLMAILTCIRHRSNISRILSGTEPEIYRKKQPAARR